MICQWKISITISKVIQEYYFFLQLLWEIKMLSRHLHYSTTFSPWPGYGSQVGSTRDLTRQSAYQPHALLQAWAIAGRPPGGKRPGDAGWQVLLIRLVLQTLPQLHWPSLDMLHHLKVFPEMPLVLVLTPYLASQHAIVNCRIVFPPFSWMLLTGWHLEFKKELFFFILPHTNYKALYCISTLAIIPLYQGKKDL